MVDDPCIAAEVQQLLTRATLAPVQLDALLLDLAIVLTHSGSAAQVGPELDPLGGEDWL